MEQHFKFDIGQKNGIDRTIRVKNRGILVQDVEETLGENGQTMHK